MEKIEMYRAFDGKAFETENECAEYETALRKERASIAMDFFNALSALDQACARSGCRDCPFRSACYKLGSGASFISYIEPEWKEILIEIKEGD